MSRRPLANVTFYDPTSSQHRAELFCSSLHSSFGFCHLTLKLGSFSWAITPHHLLSAGPFGQASPRLRDAWGTDIRIRPFY